MQVMKAAIRQVLRRLTTWLTPGGVKATRLPRRLDDWPDWLRRDILSDGRVRSRGTPPDSHRSCRDSRRR